jgi:hypothetical protein
MPSAPFSPSPVGDTLSIRRFEWLLAQRAYAFVGEGRAFERIPKRGKRPDFYVMPEDGAHVLVEVKAFEKPTWLDELDATPMFVASDRPSQARINRQVRAAAAQLAPYSDLGIPLVIALDNHRQVRLEGLGIDALAPLFGAPMRKGYDPDAPLRSDLVSAVLVNEPLSRFDDDGPDAFTVPRSMRVRVAHNPRAAVPLPLTLFATAVDEQWIYRDGGWRQLDTRRADRSAAPVPSVGSSSNHLVR